MTKKKISKEKKDKTLPIVGLILNILILPGLGTTINKQFTSGIIQMVMAIVGFLLTITILGIIVGVPLMIAAWIWALISGIKFVSDE